ncbi:hypothetical protein CBS147347_6627 [Aspergillus niger]|nr:hypothetical protein CBS147347_6627 [Aspergillus niger]
MEPALPTIEHVECRHPLFDVNLLEEPAETDQLCGKSIKTLKNFLLAKGRDIYDKLLDFHGWGYAYETVSRPPLQPRQVKMAILLRIIWNQAEYHQPQSVEELFSWERDAGPRLLRPGCIRDWSNYLPISRDYPDPPKDLHASVSLAHGSFGSSSDIPEGYLEVMGRPNGISDSDRELVDVATPRVDTAKGKQRKHIEGITDCSEDLERTEGASSTSPGDQGVEEEMTDIDEEETSDRDDGDPMEESSSGGNTPTQTTEAKSPVTRHRGSPSRSWRPSERNIEGVSGPSTAIPISQKFGKAASLPIQTAQTIIEAVQRAVMTFAYHELERHQTAVPLDIPRPWLTASPDTNLRKVQYSLHPVTAEVELHFQDDPEVPRRTFPYRGRGPISMTPRGSAIGCAIIAGRLLDAGSTNIDRKQQNWQNRLTATERAFIEATDAPCDFFDEGLSLELVERFSRMLPADVHLGVGATNMMRTVWNKSTLHFDQFAFSYEETTKQCKCVSSEDSRTTVVKMNSTTLAPPVVATDRHGVDMKDVLSRAFDHQRRTICTKCKKLSVSYEKRFHKVAMRLVVELGPNVSVRSHTEDMTLAYQNEHGHTQSVTYRWIGGIYQEEGHLLLWWTDAERGVRGTSLRSYSSSVHNGAIVGGIHQNNIRDKMSEKFWRNKQIPLLFYERVINPSIGELQVAVSAATDMLDSVSQGKLLLQQSPGWAPPERPPPEQNPYSWVPVLPECMRRFRNVDPNLQNILARGKPRTQPQPQAQAQAQAQARSQAQRQEQAVSSRPRRAQARPYSPPPSYQQSIMAMSPTPHMSADMPSSAHMSASSYGGMPPPPMRRPQYIGSNLSTPVNIPSTSPVQRYHDLHNARIYGAPAISSSPVASSRQRVDYSPEIQTNPGPYVASSPMQLTNPDSNAYGGMGQSSSPPQQAQLPPYHPDYWVNRPGHHGPRY